MLNSSKAAMLKEKALLRTVTEEAEFLIQKEYGCNWKGLGNSSTCLIDVTLASSSKMCVNYDNQSNCKNYVEHDSTNYYNNEIQSELFEYNNSSIELEPTKSKFSPKMGSRQRPTTKINRNEQQEEFLDDLSTLASTDYKDLISALYNNLPTSSNSTIESSNSIDLDDKDMNEDGVTLTFEDDKFLLDNNFLQSQIIPNSNSLNDLYDFIVANSNDDFDGQKTTTAEMTDPIAEQNVIAKSLYLTNLEVPLNEPFPSLDSNNLMLTKSNLCNSYTLTTIEHDHSYNAVHQSDCHKLINNESHKNRFVCQPLSDNKEINNAEKFLYKCFQCDYSTMSRTQIWRHRKTSGHTNEKLVKEVPKKSLINCVYCDYQTTAKFNLTRHIQRVHVGERNVLCSYCGKTFKDSDTLRVHITFVHIKIELKSEQLNKFPTKKKEFLAMSKNGLDKANTFENMKSVVDYAKQFLTSNVARSGALKLYKCKECDKAFKSSSDLHRHRRIVHLKERLFECARCGKCFQTNANARRHYTRVCALRH